MRRKTVVVTGASQGIGEAIAEEFAKHCYNLALISRNKKNLEKVIRKIKKKFDYCHSCQKNKKNLGLYIPYVCDVRDKNGLEKTFKDIWEKFGSIDVLVNNAGVNSRKILKPDSIDWLARFDDIFEGWNDEIKTNLTGTYLCSYLAAGYMLKNKKNNRGNIINISSVKGYEPTSSPGYGASKSGVIKLTRDLAKILAPYNIRVNCVAPGFIDTGMTTWLSQEKKKEYMEKIPIGRFGKVEEVAKVVRFLAGDDASYITGEIINVNGGYLMI